MTVKRDWTGLSKGETGMGERRRLLVIVIGVFFWVSSLLVWAGWWVSRGNDTAVTASQQREETNVTRTSLGGSATLPLYGELPQSLRPHSPESEAAEIVLNFIYEPLVDKKADGSVTGVLAHQWDVDEDGKKVTVHLRQGVEWHDGKPLTVDDIVHTYDTLVDSDDDGPYQEAIQSIKGAKDVQSGKATTIAGITRSGKDEHVITFHLRQPLRDVAELLQIPIIPHHMDKHSKDERTLRLAIGTGPYQIVPGDEKASIELERNPRYWDDTQPYLKRLSFKALTTDEAVSHFMQGKLDVLPQVDGGLSSTVLNETDLEPLQQTSDVFHYIAFNPRQELWHEAHMRMALGQVLDKQRIVQAWLNGAGVKVDTPRGAQIRHMRGRAPEKAQRTLQETNLTLHYSSEWIKRDELAKELQRQWKKAGYKVKLVEHENTATLARTIQLGEADLFLMTDWLRREPDLLHAWWTENSLPDWPSFSSDQFLSVLKKATKSDGKERERLTREWDELFVQETPMIPLVSPKMLYFVNENLHGVKVEDFRPGRYDVRNWFVHIDERTAKSR